MRPLLINGQWKEGPTGTPNINPSDINDTIDVFSQAGAQETREAILAAKDAFTSWSQTSPQIRHDVLSHVARELMGRKEEIGRLLSREEGKILAEGIGETIRAAQIFDFFAGEALRISGEKLSSVRPGIDVDITREPLGVIGIITPWNFPIAIPAWKIAPALCYGNTVVMKPAELVPACSWVIAEALQNAGLPAGVFNLIYGPGSVVGQAILDSPDVDAVTFTGSQATGQRVAAACAQHMRKMQLEMGGKNPLIVLDDADLDNAVDCAINGAFFSTGQRCTASSRLIVTENIHSRFVEMMTDRINALVVDHALNDQTQIGPVVDQTQLDQDLRYIEIARHEGGNLRTGGELISRPTKGYFLKPALITETTQDMTINREEVFGPVASVIRVRNYDEALDLANKSEFGLSAGICTKSLNYATHFKRNVQAGMTMVNLPTAGVDYHVPFGGTKKSSYGSREQGRYAAEFFTQIKTSYTYPL